MGVNAVKLAMMRPDGKREKFCGCICGGTCLVTVELLQDHTATGKGMVDRAAASVPIQQIVLKFFLAFPSIMHETCQVSCRG